MTTETKPTKAPRKRRSISTHRLYKEVKNFLAANDITEDDTVATLLDGLKDQVLDDLDMN